MEFEVRETKRAKSTKQDKHGNKVKIEVIQVKMLDAAGNKLVLSLDGCDDEPELGDVLQVEWSEKQTRLEVIPEFPEQVKEKAKRKR